MYGPPLSPVLAFSPRERLELCRGRGPSLWLSPTPCEPPLAGSPLLRVFCAQGRCRKGLRECVPAPRWPTRDTRSSSREGLPATPPSQHGHAPLGVLPASAPQVCTQQNGQAPGDAAGEHLLPALPVARQSPLPGVVLGVLQYLQPPHTPTEMLGS